MNANSVPKTIGALVTMATRGESGALSLGEELGLKQCTAPDIARDKEALAGRSQQAGPPDPNAPIGKQAEYVQARAAAAQARENARAAVEAGLATCTASTDVLKQPLGRRWNSRWLGAGFTGGSLALPVNPTSRLGSFRAYFRANPGHANAAMGATEASAEAALTAIATTRGLADASERAEAEAKQERDAALTQLRRRLTALRNELNLLLSPDDPRWYDFGFNRPTDGRIPALVEGVVAQPLLAGQVLVTWDPAARADNYRVTYLVVGSLPAQSIEVGLFADPTAIIAGLPSGSTVTIGVSARNDAGETQPVFVSVVAP